MEKWQLIRKNENWSKMSFLSICFFGKAGDLNTNGSNPHNRSSWTHYYPLWVLYIPNAAGFRFINSIAIIHSQFLGAHSVRNSSNHLAKLRVHVIHANEFPPIFSPLEWDLAQGRKMGGFDADIFIKGTTWQWPWPTKSLTENFGDKTHSWKCNRSLSQLSCFSFNKKLQVQYCMLCGYVSRN